MIYKDSKNNTIRNISDWENLLFKQTNKEKHWKKGRSAYEIANFLLNMNGETIILDSLEKITGEKISFDYAIPEMEIRFDKYGHGREHDVGIFGTTESKKRVFIGIESKVDETFNEKISESYLKAKSKELNHIPTNSAKRIEELLVRNFNTVEPKLFDLRYQLLYSTIGTLEAKSNDQYLDIYFLFVIVFKTELYDELKGIENYKNYIQFVNALDSVRVHTDKNIDIHKINIDGRILNMVHLNIDTINV
jgi:hypothetical protein